MLWHDTSYWIKKTEVLDISGHRKTQYWPHIEQTQENMNSTFQHFNISTQHSSWRQYTHRKFKGYSTWQGKLQFIRLLLFCHFNIFNSYTHRVLFKNEQTADATLKKINIISHICQDVVHLSPKDLYFSYYKQNGWHIKRGQVEQNIPLSFYGCFN